MYKKLKNTKRKKENVIKTNISPKLKCYQNLYEPLTNVCDPKAKVKLSKCCFGQMEICINYVIGLDLIRNS